MTATSSELSGICSAGKVSSEEISNTKAEHLLGSYSAWPFTILIATSEKSQAYTNSRGSGREDRSGNTVLPTPHPTSKTAYRSS